MSASPRPAGRPLLPFLSSRAALCFFKPSCRLLPAWGLQFPFVRSASVSAWVSQIPSQKKEVAHAAPLCFASPCGKGNGKLLASLSSFQEPLWGPTGPIQP